MGLPGSGKTTLAQWVVDYLQREGKRIGWLNADDVRKKYDDWDFSEAGRIRQSKRMRELADAMTDMDYVICDFVAPLAEMRNNFKADWTVWVDTIREGRYADTNAMFQEPEVYDFRITEQRAEWWGWGAADLQTRAPPTQARCLSLPRAEAAAGLSPFARAA